MRRATALAGALASALLLAACTEDVGSGAACPALCPDEALATRDTVLDPLVLDTTLAGYPGRGREGVLTLAERGDTLSTRVVMRFDTVPSIFTPANGTATPYTALESATLILPVDSSRTAAPGALAVDVYDVEAADVDTTASVLLPLFRGDRRLGAAEYASRAAMSDTLRVPLNPAVVLARLQGGVRLRLGLRLRATGSAQVNIEGSDLSSTAGARLRLRVAGDTTNRDVVLNSRTPLTPVGAAGELRDFTLVARAPGAPPAGAVAAGGVLGRRGLLQFSVPAAILDSSTVVRATLELTQAPNRAAAEAATPTTVYLQPVAAAEALADTLPSGALRDPSRVASLLCPLTATTDGAIYCPTTNALGVTSQFRLDSIVRAPRDSGTVRFEIGALVRIWQAAGTPASARAVVLRTPARTLPTAEGLQGGELYVYSKEAVPALRPRLRLTYVTRSSYALP